MSANIISRDFPRTGNGMQMLIRMIGTFVRTLSRPRTPAILKDLDDRLLRDIGLKPGDHW